MWVKQRDVTVIYGETVSLNWLCQGNQELVIANSNMDETETFTWGVLLERYENYDGIPYKSTSVSTSLYQKSHVIVTNKNQHPECLLWLYTPRSCPFREFNVELWRVEPN